MTESNPRPNERDRPRDDSDQWAAADSLLDAVLDVEPDERAEWLQKACDGDDALETRVRELLLLAEREGDGLEPRGALEGPVWEDVAEELDRGGRPKTFRAGEVIGTFEIVRSLGSGGMGQVYLANDTKLGRQVALKVLPPEMGLPEHKKRFEREAKAVAALNHPNIVQVYSIQETEGIQFITMELVQGKTLAELIPNGGMGLGAFFSTSRDMAGAVAAAHDRGIIHRDLKPPNVMVGDDGRVKILDFGLAKPAPGSADSGLTTTDAETQKGLILGTVAYMSPEQAEAKDFDHRTDVFSLGVVFYQMITGHLPFRGDNAAATISSILRDEPRDVGDIRRNLPPDLSRIVRKCLAKDPDRRYQSVLDLRNDLEDLHYQLDSKKLFQAVTPERDKFPMTFITVTLAVVAIVTGYFALSGRDVPQPPQPSFAELTSTPDEETFPTIAPDGRFVAYASRIDGAWDIYLLRAGGQRPINLTEAEGEDETQPAFSPDGERIAFRSTGGGGGLFVMGATGEFIRQLTSFGWNPTWSSDGREIVFATEGISRHPFDRPTTSELWIVDVESGETRQLSEGDAVQPAWSPGGERIAYWGLVGGTGVRDIWTIPSTGGQPKPVTQDDTVDWNPVWSADGKHLYFSSERGGSMNLWRVAIDESTGDTSGEPEPITAPSSFASHLSVSADGNRIAYASSSIENRLFAIDFDPTTLTVSGEPRAIARDLRDIDGPNPSPNGDWLVFTRSGQEDILISGPDGSQWRQLTDDLHRDRQPVVSPDGTQIAFYSNRGGSYEVWVMGFDGSDLRALTDIPDQNLRYPFWSPDGKRLGFSYPDTSGLVIDVDKRWAEQTPQEFPPYPDDSSHFVPLDWSPDGERVAGHLFSKAGVRAGVASLELESGRYEELTEFGWFPKWSADSEHIVFMAAAVPSTEGRQGYLQDLELFAVNRVTKEITEIMAHPGRSLTGPALTADTRLLYFVEVTFESDIWLISLDDASSESTQ